MKISKKVRDQAILLSSILASTAHAAWTPYYEIADISREAFDLWSVTADYVDATIKSIADLVDLECSLVRNAEVECLLREGWSPGET